VLFLFSELSQLLVGQLMRINFDMMNTSNGASDQPVTLWKNVHLTEWGIFLEKKNFLQHSQSF